MPEIGITNEGIWIEDKVRLPTSRCFTKTWYRRSRNYLNLYRIVFNMYVIDGYTHQEIANQLKIAVVALPKSNLSKARTLLQSYLKNWLAKTCWTNKTIWTTNYSGGQPKTTPKTEPSANWDDLRAGWKLLRLKTINRNLPGGRNTAGSCCFITDTICHPWKNRFHFSEQLFAAKKLVLHKTKGSFRNCCNNHTPKRRSTANHAGRR